MANLAEDIIEEDRNAIQEANYEEPKLPIGEIKIYIKEGITSFERINSPSESNFDSMIGNRISTFREKADNFWGRKEYKNAVSVLGKFGRGYFGGE